jgi:enoyl-CoA hydratase
MQEVLFHQQHHIGIITLNRPQALNALSYSMVMKLLHQLQAWEVNETIHAVIIRSGGGKAFCAGGDVRSLYEMGKNSPENALQFFSNEYRLNTLIHQYKKPYIALMDGITMGGGVGVSLHGSHPVASHTFVFAMPETSIGFFPDIGASFLLARCEGNMGVYLGLTGERLSAHQAYALGLVRYVIPASHFDNVIEALIGLDLSTEAEQKVTHCLSALTDPVDTAVLELLQSNVTACFNEQQMQSIIQNLEKRHDDWCLNVLNTLKHKSPLSLCVTLEQLIRAKQMNFKECIQMDTILVQHFIRGHDFYEGVRALLIDKDKSPQWKPATLSEVDLREIDTYFSV